MKRLAVLAGIVLAAACGCGRAAPVAAVLHPHLAPPRPASQTRYLGYAGPAGSLTGFAAATGTRPDMITEYLQPGDPFSPPPPGVTPLVSVATTMPPAAVLAGAQDRALSVLARQVAAYRKPVAVSIDPEGNGPWYSYGTQHATAAQYIALYRHVHDVLERAGARNAIWVWTISNSPPITHQALLKSLYPGDGYVDWVGVDGYFIGSENSYPQVFTRVFGEVRQFTRRPFLIAETSVQPGPYAAQWVRDLFAGAESDPAVLGFVWFDYDKSAQLRDDWRIEDDPAALAAFRAAAKTYGQ